MNQRLQDAIRSVRDALMHAATHIEPELVARIVAMEQETRRQLEDRSLEDSRRNAYGASADVLTMILKNITIADETHLPLCQDTGMVIAFVSIGPHATFTMDEVQYIISEGAKEAAIQGNFRNSVVQEPLFDRKNTGNNLPPIIHWQQSKRPGIIIDMMLKGFGSENCSSLDMLNPTARVEDIVHVVKNRVIAAGGKPCPPIVVGVGLGGSAERALQLSKLALLRPVGVPHQDPRYAALERQIEKAIQHTHVGPGGLGGPLTTLGVAVAYEPTHIAGLPVGISISCWADRKAQVVLEADDA